MRAVEAEGARGPEAVRGVRARGGTGAGDAGRLARRVRLPNAETKRLEQVAAYHGPGVDMDDARLRARLYAMDRAGCRDTALMAWAASREGPDNSDWHDLMTRIGEVPVPKFPLQGADIVEMGVPQGPAVGQILG